jgi:hypothetical protein
MLLLDESADAKAGTQTAGAGRQRNGRLGKVDLCQVGVFLSFVKDNTWTWVDGELFLQEHWFEPKMEDERKRLGIPPDRTFKTKVQNVRELLRAVMPLPQLSREQAAEQVVKHLVNRTRSRRSRVKKKSSRAIHRARDPA